MNTATQANIINASTPAERDYFASFISWLRRMESDPGAMARLRRSLSRDSDSFPVEAAKYVEPFLAAGCSEGQRRAMYLVAGLFARSPKSSSRTFAQAMAKVYRDAGETDSIEKRFIAVMASDEGEIAERLRHAMALIASKDLGVDFAQLCRDLVTLMDPGRDKDAVRKRWARDFYGTAPARRTRPASAD